MRLSKLIGQRIKEKPRDAETISHIFLIRGGYCRPVSAGIYSLLPLGRRITAKIEAIIREEMNAIEGQEVLMPLVQPAELWAESGRLESISSELLRFKDRNDKPMVLAMTHEEATCQLARTEIVSYKQMPSMFYQIQLKYRDEARPRGGLIRVREFTMKDAYSFHTSFECLDHYYKRVHAAYERIFNRCGLQHFVSIESDSGMIGGKLSHEFMAVADCGEDTLFVNNDGTYQANREVAVAAYEFPKAEPLPLEEVHTPQAKTIEEVAAFLQVTPEQTGKAVFFADHEDKLVFVMIRGDFEVNEIKLQKVLLTPSLRFATDEEIEACGAVPGFASILNIDPTKCRIVIDPSAAYTNNLVIGANKADYHIKNFCYERDGNNAGIVADISCVRDGDPCPITKTPLKMCRGIEIGNIFQLGTRYSEKMGCNYLDKDGKAKPIVMGCYGIGVGRTMAAIIEQNHDDYGPVWPESVAPYHVHIVAIQPNNPEVKETAENLYNALCQHHIEVIYDDRGEKPGSMFADADLIGAPYRVIISPKTLAENNVEFKTRNGQIKENVQKEFIFDKILNTIKNKN